MENDKMICIEPVKNIEELVPALRRIVQLARIALNAGRIIQIDLKEKKVEEDPILAWKDRVALGLSGLCQGE